MGSYRCVFSNCWIERKKMPLVGFIVLHFSTSCIYNFIYKLLNCGHVFLWVNSVFLIYLLYCMKFSVVCAFWRLVKLTALVNKKVLTIETTWAVWDWTFSLILSLKVTLNNSHGYILSVSHCLGLSTSSVMNIWPFYFKKQGILFIHC